MSHEHANPPPLSHSILRMLETALTGGMTFDTLTNILALLCLLNILQRGQPVAAAPAPAAPAPSGGGQSGANPLHKILGDLMKGDGGGSGDALTSLLPLLNNPQIKSKLTPTNIAAILGLINTLGGSGEAKHDKSEKPAKQESKQEGSKDAPAATVTSEPETLTSVRETDHTSSDREQDNKDKNRYLNWKNNF